MSDEEKMPIGKCRFCGQTAIIQTVGEISQDERDIMATDKCMCPEAQSERRKKERREAIEKFVRKNFDEAPVPRSRNPGASPAARSRAWNPAPN